MRVAIDGRHLRPGADRGVGRYSRMLVSALADGHPGDDWVAVSADPLEGVAGVQVRRPRIASRRTLFAAAAVTGRPRLDRLAGGCDVAFVPAPAPVAISAEVPFVLTVHDLSFEHHPADYGAYERAWHRLASPRGLARRARRVIAVSPSVAAQVVTEWDVPAERVTTVLSGPGRPPGAPGPLPPGLPDTFVLAVGALEPRKRPDLLVRAHALARDRGLRAGLVFAGEGPMRPELEEQGARVLGRADDATVDALYARALALACISREEGFGFTPLEGAVRGCPAVVADLEVFDSTVGAGAVRVAPGDEGALAEALVSLERDPALRARLAEAGAAAAGALSWERAARATHSVLTEAAGA